MTPYYADYGVTIYHGDCREVLPTLPPPDLVVADPPYGETTLEWDTWPEGWVNAVRGSSMWCFGSMRMLLSRRDDFAQWRLSQDIVWQKPNGSGPGLRDRFYRVHELVTHWYRGTWADTYHVTPTTQRIGPPKNWRASGSPQAPRNEQRGDIGQRAGYDDDGTRLQQSVMLHPSMRHRALHPTEKPLGVLLPLIEYGCPPGGMVIDPFGGSGSTAIAARSLGRSAILIEAQERYCEIAVQRLAQGVLDFS